MYKPLNQCITQSNELKKLIKENPDLPLVALVDSEVCASDSFNWWFAPTIVFGVGDFLDCEQTVNEEKIYSDKDDFEEDLSEALINSGKYDDLTDEEFEKVVTGELKKYEPYWTKVIYIKATL